jgi:hypothetical protein
LRWQAQIGPEWATAAPGGAECATTPGKRKSR